MAVESSEYRATACTRLRRRGGFWEELVDADETDRVPEYKDVSTALADHRLYGESE